MAFTYPVNLDIQGRRCVVVGGGKIAEDKVMGLVEAGANVRVIAPRLTTTLEELFHSGRVEVSRKEYSSGDLDGVFLAIAATDDTAVNAQVFAEAEELKVLLCSVDDIDHCHFAAPATVRRGDFLLTISTAGKAPALAKRVRKELGSSFGPEWGALVEVLSETRSAALALGARECGFDEWAKRWGAALDQDVMGLVVEDRIEEAKSMVLEVLLGGSPDPDAAQSHQRDKFRSVAGSRMHPAPSSAPDASVPQRASSGKVSLVGAGPGDPELLTVRGRRALDQADVVIHDRLVHRALLSGRPAIYAGKQAGNHHMSQEEVNSLLVRLARKGKNVVRLKGGDPFVFGRGSEEAEALAAAGIPFEIIPAPTSALAALATAGIPATDRRFSSSVAIVTGHRSREQDVKLKELATTVDTIVVLMGLATLPTTVAELIAGGRDPDTPAAIIENGTLPEQRVIVSSLAHLPGAAAEAAVESPATIVIGEVVRLRDRLISPSHAGRAASSL
ncbi:MAG: uroporphyrinogen-III C-methyltransferase [Actinomycetota bacterium]|nr:uroporphyrinogen-III C-methyltransferase [Actinomycetota bacterium]